MAVYSSILKKKTPVPEFVAWPQIDTLYDYIGFIEKGPIAQLPKDQWGTEVVIIGAGDSGL